MPVDLADGDGFRPLSPDELRQRINARDAAKSLFVIVTPGTYSHEQVAVIIGQVQTVLARHHRRRLDQALRMGTAGRIWLALTWAVAFIALGLFAWDRLAH